MNRHEMWRQQYRVRRYMEYLPHDELIKRFKDVWANQFLLTKNNGLGVLSPKADGEYWIVRFTHLLEELSIREISLDTEFHSEFVRDTEIPHPDSRSQRACEVIRDLNIPPGTCLFKYGKYRWLSELWEKGVVRIYSASSYNDSSLNRAVQDNELQLSISQLPSEIHIAVRDKDSGRLKGAGRPLGYFTETQSAKCDFYVYCLSSVFEPRLFSDFEADACLVIYRPDYFCERLFHGMERQCEFQDAGLADVRYIDPLTSSRDEVDVFTSKHFRYAYQKEARLIWIPGETTDCLTFRQLEIGPTTDCCELVQL